MGSFLEWASRQLLPVQNAAEMVVQVPDERDLVGALPQIPGEVFPTSAHQSRGIQSSPTAGASLAGISPRCPASSTGGLLGTCGGTGCIHHVDQALQPRQRHELLAILYFMVLVAYQIFMFTTDVFSII